MSCTITATLQNGKKTHVVPLKVTKVDSPLTFINKLTSELGIDIDLNSTLLFCSNVPCFIEYFEEFPKVIFDLQMIQVDVINICVDVLQGLIDRFDENVLPAKLKEVFELLNQSTKIIPLRSSSQHNVRNQTQSSAKKKRLSLVSSSFKVEYGNIPQCSYDDKLPNLIQIKNPSGSIPALWFKISKPSINIKPITILYFHDGGEDLGNIRESIHLLSETYFANVLAIEYPSYGIYSNQSISDEKLAKEIEFVYLYLIGVKKGTRILLMGKGIGCSFVFYLTHYLYKTIDKRKQQGGKRGTEIIEAVILHNPKMSFNLFSSSYFENLKMIKTNEYKTYLFFDETSKYLAETKKIAHALKQLKRFEEVRFTPYSNELSQFAEYIDNLQVTVLELFPEYTSVFDGSLIQKMKPKFYQNNPFEIISDFLKKKNLHHLTDVLISFGYISVEDLLYMNKSEIDALGIDDNEKDLLFQFIQSELLSRQPSLSPRKSVSPPVSPTHKQTKSQSLPYTHVSNAKKIFTMYKKCTIRF
ncbi:SAM domain-containing protein [Entamoeba marina]